MRSRTLSGPPAGQRRKKRVSSSCHDPTLSKCAPSEALKPAVSWRPQAPNQNCASLAWTSNTTEPRANNDSATPRVRRGHGLPARLVHARPRSTEEATSSTRTRRACATAWAPDDTSDAMAEKAPNRPSPGRSAGRPARPRRRGARRRRRAPGLRRSRRPAAHLISRPTRSSWRSAAVRRLAQKSNGRRGAEAADAAARPSRRRRVPRSCGPRSPRT